VLEGADLKQRVHVAGGALILQAHVARVLFTVPRDAVRRVCIHFHFKYDSVVLKKKMYKKPSICDVSGQFRAG
jgi:hypothetical protein